MAYDNQTQEIISAVKEVRTSVDRLYHLTIGIGMGMVIGVLILAYLW